MMAVNKIDLMHRIYGRRAEENCDSCSHMARYRYHDKYYYKCEIYGVTNSEASDWRCKYVACGLYNAETTVHDVIRFVTPERRKEILNEPLHGQIGFFEEEDG